MSEKQNKVAVNLQQDFTESEKAQARMNIGAAAAADIPAAPVQSDWTEADTTSLSYIQHKPVIPQAQVNSDWAASSGVSEILNKPNIPTIYLDYGMYRDTVASATVDMLASKQVTFTNPQAATDSPGFFAPTFDTDFDVGKVLTATDQGYPAWEYPIYEVVYGTTTYQQIADAYAEHKIIYCKVSSSGSTRIALLSNANPGTSGIFEFTEYKSVNHNYTTQADEVNVYTCTNTSSNQWSTTNRYGTYNIKTGSNMSYTTSGNNLTLGLSQVRLRDAVHAGYTAPLTTNTYVWDVFGGAVELTVEVLAAPDNNHCSHVSCTIRNKNSQTIDIWGQVFSDIAGADPNWYTHPCCWATNNTGASINMETLNGATSSVGVGVWLAADELTNVAGRLVFDVMYSKNNVAHAGRIQIIRGSFLYVSSEYDSEA